MKCRVHCPQRSPCPSSNEIPGWNISRKEEGQALNEHSFQFISSLAWGSKPSSWIHTSQFPPRRRAKVVTDDWENQALSHPDCVVEPRELMPCRNELSWTLWIWNSVWKGWPYSVPGLLPEQWVWETLKHLRTSPASTMRSRHLSVQLLREKPSGLLFLRATIFIYFQLMQWKWICGDRWLVVCVV